MAIDVCVFRSRRSITSSTIRAGTWSKQVILRVTRLYLEGTLGQNRNSNSTCDGCNTLLAPLYERTQTHAQHIRRTHRSWLSQSMLMSVHFYSVAAWTLSRRGEPSQRFVGGVLDEKRPKSSDDAGDTFQRGPRVNDVDIQGRTYTLRNLTSTPDMTNIYGALPMFAKWHVPTGLTLHDNQ